jgi:DNA repair protein RecO (recombination protein O)
MSNDLRTKGIVLRRTNYGEADRILTIITKDGQVSALAKGARKLKSKLAGSIELFSYSEFVFHKGKGELLILTNARLIEYYSHIMTNLEAIKDAGIMMKEINHYSNHVDSDQFLDILQQTMQQLDNLVQQKQQFKIVLIWFYINLWKISGEELNLHTDSSGNKLQPNTTYNWSFENRAFSPSPNGHFTTNHIKLLRLIASNRLSTVLHIEGYQKQLPEIEIILKNYQ